jgi:hypothetical protein
MLDLLIFCDIRLPMVSTMQLEKSKQRLAAALNHLEKVVEARLVHPTTPAVPPAAYRKLRASGREAVHELTASITLLETLLKNHANDHPHHS